MRSDTTSLRAADRGIQAPEAVHRLDQYVCVYLGNQIFGIPVLAVQDVLDSPRIAPVPLAPAEVAGLLNLRGRIATAIDLRRRLGMPRRDGPNSMSVVIERDGELYSLLVDSVGEVVSLSSAALEPNPPTLAQGWRDVSCGVHPVENALLIVFDISRLLEFGAEVESN